ncbi:ATP synthase F1 subunit gamma [Phycisphaerales bacterium ac7]
MANTRDLKKRIKAIKSIRRITKTMQMIATSKFARSQQRATQSKPYTEGIFDLVTELAEKAGNISHELIDGPRDGFKPGAKPLVLVITSDRGLCGPYNGSILRAAMKHLRGLDDYNLEVVGRKGQSVLKFNKFNIDAAHNQFGDKPTFEEVEKLARQYMDRFAAGEITSVHVVYMRFISTARQRPSVLQLLPLKPPAVEHAEGETAGASSVEYDFTPEPAELLSSLLPETVKATLFQAFLDAVVSENVARMVAMKAATDNAGEMGRLIGRKYNRARQAQITTELTEIISGAAALE